MPGKVKIGKSPTRKQPGTSEESTVKFRSKILGLSAVSEQNATTSGAFDDKGESPDQKDVAAQLQEELNRRQESYVRRERQYKVRISELEAQLSESRAKKGKEGSLDASMEEIRQMHRNIIESVDQVQDRTSKILQEQEKDLLRAFRARLYSVQEELESEKNKTDDGASAWIEKSKQLETEVEWTKELADRLDRLNQSLTRENQRLKTQFTTQENDREFLVKQLVSVKKDNVRLRNEYEALQRQLEQLRDETEHGDALHQLQPHSSMGVAAMFSASTSALPKMGAGGGGGLSFGASSILHRPNTAVSGLSTSAVASMTTLPEADNRYKEIIKRLKRLLEVERRNLQQVRTSYKQELQNRTELELLLKECIQDVRNEISHHGQLPMVAGNNNSNSSIRKPGGAPPQSGASSPLVDARLGAVERQRVVEKLLAKERLLQLLSAKAFPLRAPHRSDPLFTGDEMTKIYAEVSRE
uniref:Cilia- and flagella-associated protein 157 n=1 Tax=Globisporangium ultimum (strain ATCC 200006 / CBS 805.95 / DAOM BR144) TaxID=431595 RepID=K3X1U5_GLOUD